MHWLVRLSVRSGLEDELLALAERAGFGTGAGLRDYPQGLLADEADEPLLETCVHLWVPVATLAALEGWITELCSAWSVEATAIRILDQQPADLSVDPERLWQSQWRPFRCAGFTVRANFHDATLLPAKAGDLPLILVPGSAFGTGGHPTTRMALRAVRRIHSEAVPGPWLDVGTGSGILAVAAALLGETSVFGMDPDPHSAEQALAMAALNGVGSRVSAWRGRLDSTRGRFAAVVANLFADLLQDVAADLAERLEPGGLLYAGGIVDRKWEATQARFTAAGLQFVDLASRGRWRGALWQRPVAARIGNRS